MKFNPPNNDELEITIFGSGYGESILVHLTNGKWLIVDSCISRDVEFPCPIEYLKRIGVDVGESVAMVVATHWHDDHIKGMSKIFEDCPKAKPVFSAAFNDTKFMKLVMDSALSRLSSINPSTGISEISKSWNLLRKRNNKIIFALSDKLLMDNDFQIYSLSPSDEIFEKAILSILSQLPTQNTLVKRINPPRSNHASVVLWLKNNLERVLLGSDLEEASDYKGWSVLIDGIKSTIVDKKASIYKVAHHGSRTGHHDEIWTKLLEKNPICLIAPFNKNPKLPSEEDLTRISKNSDLVFLSSSTEESEKATRIQDKHVKRTLQKRNATHVDSKFSFVRHRKKPDESWGHDLFGDSTKFNHN